VSDDLPLGARTDRVDLDDPNLDLISLQAHVARYSFVFRQLESESDVIEVGCGTGYGAFAMSSKCNSVVGFDPYVDMAKLSSKWTRPNLRFVESLEGLGGKFDAILSMEVIEHMPRNEADNFILKLKELGHAESKWFLSTPRVLPDELRTENRKRAHPFEYTYEGFRSLLKTHFKHVHLFSQNDGVISSQNPSMAWNFVSICTD
jgi:2-polyprenyl-3-methyl-5-hydroxy-6-metoxy-1,4-benzoquinol methylase